MTSGMHCFVSGRVQGVFFRQSTRARAVELELTGWVRNLNDGRVELKAFGAPENLHRLKQWLHQGPPAAQVTSVECRTIPAENGHANFSVGK